MSELDTLVAMKRDSGVLKSHKRGILCEDMCDMFVKVYWLLSMEEAVSE